MWLAWWLPGGEWLFCPVKEIEYMVKKVTMPSTKALQLDNSPLDK